MNRRDFLKNSSALSLCLLNNHLLASPMLNKQQTTTLPKLSLVKNGTPKEMVQKAVEVVGGISKFVKKGDVVIVKPNIGWARRPEQAANTNPEVVAEIVRLCKTAGASKVKVFDYTCNEAKRCYRLSGIEKAAKSEGAQVQYIYKQKFKSMPIPEGKILKSWEFYDDVLKADVFINVPIIKHHSMAKVSMSMKNIMGIIGGNRGQIHTNFDKKIVDLNTAIRPHLIILDGVRVLKRNGPVGGNLADVEQANTIIAGTDPVAIDSLGATVFGIDGKSIIYIQEASKRGLGEIDLEKVNIEKVDLSG